MKESSTSIYDMNFYDMNELLKQHKFRDYMDDATSGGPTAGVHEKQLSHELTPLSFKDMMRYAAPEYEQTNEPIQSMGFDNLQGYGGQTKPITDLKSASRPNYDSEDLMNWNGA